MAKVKRVNQLVDYEAFYNFYNKGGFKSPMGNFKMEFLTPLGLKVVELGREMFGCVEAHRGANKAGMYLKWLIVGPLGKGSEGKQLGPDDDPLFEFTATVFLDKLNDMGLEVKSEVLANRETDQRSPVPKAGKELDTRRYVKVTIW